VIDASGVFDKIAPSIGVAKQQELDKKRQEIAVRLRDVMRAKQKEEEEKGGSELVTNLPLELLFKQKMEQKIKAEMEASGQ
jgi:hypothetical protein